MIKLTDPDGTPVYINPDKVSAVFDNNECTAVFYGESSGRIVTESPSEVSRLITEYKQRQMRLQAAYAMLYRGEDRAIIDEIGLLESEDRGE